MKDRPRSSAALLALAYLAFVSLGLPDALLGVAWPSLRDDFRLTQAFLGAPVAAAAVAYFVSGLFAGRLMEGVGIGLLLAGSTALVALGVFGIAAAPAFWIVLLASPIVGFGSGAIDSGLNTYAARNFSQKHMSWLHAAYAAGATAGPAIMTAVLASGASWRFGYGLVGSMLVALTVAFTGARRRWETAGTPPEHVLIDAPGNLGPVEVEPGRVSGFAAVGSGRVWLQIAVFFFYTGIEVTVGQWSYTLLTESRGVDAPAAGSWVAAYWGGLLAGRLVLGFVVEQVGQVRLLRMATIGVVLSTALFAFVDDAWSAVALPLLSFSLASIYPGLMAETPRRVGEHLAPHAVGFQVSAATLGIAVLPAVAGFLSQRFTLEAIGPLIAGCAVVLVLLHEWLTAIADRVSVPR